MIDALLVIFRPVTAWDRLAQKRLGVKFILLSYLLPLLLLLAAAEGDALVHWGKWQPDIGALKHFSAAKAALFEMGQLLLTLAFVFVCAHAVKSLGGTFHSRHTYAQAFTVVAYGLSPLFFLRLFDVFPELSPWIPWSVGIVLSLRVLYHGVPPIMLPDPPHALGLYFSGSLLLVAAAALLRFVTAWGLEGKMGSGHSYLSHLLSRLHFW